MMVQEKNTGGSARSTCHEVYSRDAGKNNSGPDPGPGENVASSNMDIESGASGVKTEGL